MKVKTGMETEYEEYKRINADDAYSHAVVVYGEAWANLMEARLTNGELVREIAKECSHTADTDGITGFMYGCAVSALAHFWEYGEELRRWHNLDTQLGNEGEKANESGGVLNSALLNIG